MHRLLILSRHAAEYARLVEAERLPDLALVPAREADEAIRAGADCALALGEPSLLARALPALPRLRWIQATWAGVEPLLAPGLRRDYALTNARGIFGPAVVEYVFAYLLAHERRLLQRFAAQQAARWDSTPPGTLRGRVLGLLGVGSIGAALAATARHFGLRVRGYTRASEDCPDVDDYYHDGGLLAFAAGLDYLVCTLPGTAATRGLVDAALLGALPARALFVNAGRGSVVDEAALLAALEAGHLAGAVLDVFAEEPLPSGHPLWRAPNVLITAHTAAPTDPADLAALFADNYRRWLRGEPLRYAVSFERGY